MSTPTTRTTCHRHNDRPDILVIGGTGSMGREVLAALRRRDVAARALVRDPARLATRDGVEVCLGDLRDGDSLRRAVEGARIVFSMSPHEADEIELARAVVDACEQAGARLVFAGVHVTSRTRPGAWLMRKVYGRIMPKYRGKMALAAAIERSRTDPVILVPSNFMQNDEVLLEEILHGRFVQPCSPKGLNRVDLRDVGEIAANILVDPAFPGGTYDLVGPRSLSGPECAQVWAEALGTEVRYVGDDDAALEAALTAHLTGQRRDDWLSSMHLLRSFEVKTNPKELAATTRLLGRPPTDFTDYVRRVTAERHLAAGAVAAS